MDRTEVSSASIRAIGYDAASLTLEIEFHNGTVYQYFGVPQHEYDNFIAAASIGAYFSRAIRGGYPFARA